MILLQVNGWRLFYSAFQYARINHTLWSQVSFRQSWVSILVDSRNALAMFSPMQKRYGTPWNDSDVAPTFEKAWTGQVDGTVQYLSLIFAGKFLLL